jgi:hypothetical protein
MLVLVSALVVRSLAGAVVVVLAAACGGDDFQAQDDGLKDASGEGSGGKSGSGGTANGGSSTGGGGTGGTAGKAGSGGTGASGGSAGTDGAGGSGTSGASHGGATGSAGDSGVIDASSDGSAGLGGSGGATDAGDGAIQDTGTCDAPTVYFRDEDGDEYGARDGEQASCSPLGDGWTDEPGDCNDERAEVNPGIGALLYFGEPHASGSTSSFDYDCDNVEQADPSQFGAAVACPGTSIGCNKKGFAPTSRTGPNVNPYCGSTTLVTCTPSGLNCNAIATQVAPKRCR